MQTINITVPRGWHELTQRQLRYLFFLISEGYSSTAIKTLCLFRWSGLRVISRKQGQFYLRLNKTEFFVTALQIAEAVTSLAWVDSYSKMPVRFERICRHRAVRADFQGVPFETFIVCENLYQGFLHTQNEELLSQMANTSMEASVYARTRCSASQSSIGSHHSKIISRVHSRTSCNRQEDPPGKICLAELPLSDGCCKNR